MISATRKVAATAAIIAATSFSASAQTYPAKPVRFVVNFAPGGGTDIVARAMAAEFTKSLGQQFVVENRAGANGNIGADVVAKAPADGYTVLMTTNAPIVINPHLYGKMPFDPQTDLAPVTQLVTLPFVLATHPSVPVKSVKDLLALAKSTPKGLVYGSSGTGGGAHLAGEMMKNMTGANITHVPYKGGAPAITGLLSGEVDFMFISILTVTPLLKEGRLRPVAVTSPARNKSLPDIPSMSEFPALKGAESDLWYGMVVPAKTDRRVIDVLQKESARVLALPDFKNRFEPTGSVLVASSPDAFAKLIRAEYDRWGKVVKAAGTKAE